MKRRHEGDAGQSRGIAGQTPLRKQDRHKSHVGEDVKEKNGERVVAPVFLGVGLQTEDFQEPTVSRRDAGGRAPLGERKKPEPQGSRDDREYDEKKREEFERVEHRASP